MTVLRKANRGVYQATQVWNEALRSRCARRVAADGEEERQQCLRSDDAGWETATATGCFSLLTLASLQLRGAMGWTSEALEKLVCVGLLQFPLTVQKHAQ